MHWLVLHAALDITLPASTPGHPPHVVATDTRGKPSDSPSYPKSQRADVVTHHPSWSITSNHCDAAVSTIAGTCKRCVVAAIRSRRVAKG